MSSSWLSLFNPYEDETAPDHSMPDSSPSSSSPGGGGIGHVLRGVADFLAPPPQQSSPAAETTSTSSSKAITGVKKDLAEIEESFKSSLSLLSTKLTTSFIQFTNNDLNYAARNSNISENKVIYSEGFDTREEEEEEEVPGTSEKVVDFVRELSSRPEFWTDFPADLPNDFDMSVNQKEHAACMERLVPSLATLKEKCCSQLSDGQFWMIYFTILLPRLNEYDLAHLSTPEVIEVREKLIQKLQNEKNTLVETVDDSDTRIASEMGTNIDSTQGDVVLSRQNSSAGTSCSYQDVGSVDHLKQHRWLKEHPEPSISSSAHRQVLDEVEMSFSDLDDEKDSFGFRQEHRHSIGSTGERNEWIQLSENSGTRASQSEGEELNDWHHVDYVDLESLARVNNQYL